MHAAEDTILIEIQTYPYRGNVLELVFFSFTFLMEWVCFFNYLIQIVSLSSNLSTAHL